MSRRNSSSTESEDVPNPESFIKTSVEVNAYNHLNRNLNTVQSNNNNVSGISDKLFNYVISDIINNAEKGKIIKIEESIDDLIVQIGEMGSNTTVRAFSQNDNNCSQSIASIITSDEYQEGPCQKLGYMNTTQNTFSTVSNKNRFKKNSQEINSNCVDSLNQNTLENCKTTDQSFKSAQLTTENVSTNQCDTLQDNMANSISGSNNFVLESKTPNAQLQEPFKDKNDNLNQVLQSLNKTDDLNKYMQNTLENLKTNSNQQQKGNQEHHRNNMSSLENFANTNNKARRKSSFVSSRTNTKSESVNCRRNNPYKIKQKYIATNIFINSTTCILNDASLVLITCLLLVIVACFLTYILKD